ncbi:MAG: lysophospholipase [Ruminococcaceae bacterium]|nr:lysophospholipase [Oscillospiraceae bacterium]
MKRIISLALSLILAFSLCVPAFAANETVDYNGDPIVVVRGIDFAGLVKDDGSKAITVDAFDVFNLVLDIGSYKARGDKDATINAIVQFGKNLFSDVACDKEGNPLNPDVHIPKFLTSADKIDLSGDEWADTAVGLFRSLANRFGGKNVYLYTFDWRLSPSALADDLNSFLELVKTETGKDKLDIAACSMGGMITTAYIDKYGTDSLDSVVFLSSAHNGGDIVGSAFTGDLSIGGDMLSSFVISKVSTNWFLKILIKLLDILGIVDSLANFVDDVITTHKDIIYDDFLCETFATAYGLWSLIPDEYFDEAVKLFFEGKEGYDTALAEIEKVRSFVTGTEEILAKATASDTKISFVSHYNSAQLPIYSSCDMHGDGVLESKRTSGNGTFAKYGETLTDSELEGVPAEFISPDRVVNASTCLYKDVTWIVKNAKHVGCKDNSDHTEFAIWLLTQDVQPTVTTNPAYPRFMNTDANENFIAF